MLIIAAITIVAVLVAISLYFQLAKRDNVIYMDYNGTTPIHPSAAREHARVLRRYFGNPSTACVAGRLASEVLESSRCDIASEIGCRQTELVFTSGATEANVLVLRGFAAHAARQGRACHIVTTPIEHASVASTCESLELDGVSVWKTPVDRFGFVDAGGLSVILSDLPEDALVLVAVIWINNEIGTIQDVAAISRECQMRGDTFLHLDATQVIGRYRVDLAQTGADFVCFSGHKFRGPHGVGGLFVKSESTRVLEPIMTGGKQEKGLRGGTENVAACAAMAVALKTSHAKLGAARRVREMRDRMRTRLMEAIPGIVLNSPLQRCAFNTLSMCLPCDSRELVAHLSEVHRVCLATGSACSKGTSSSTLQALGVASTALRGSLRISLGFENTQRECDFVATKIIEFLRDA